MLVKWVNESTTITTLNLHFVKITDDVFKTLCDGIMNPRLTTLNLGYDMIGNEGVKRIATKLPNLTTLELQSNDIDDEGAITLSSMTKLTTLNVCSNRIGDEGAIALSSMTNLTALYLSRNKPLKVESLEFIATKLVNLKVFHYESNEIGNEGTNVLSTMMNLEELNLWGNYSMNDEDAIALSKMTNLKTLYLSEIELGIDGAIALSNLPNLRTLQLFDDKIHHEDAIVSLTKSPKLTTLDLHWNHRIENPDALLSAFDAHPTLFDLIIDVVYGTEDYERIEAIKNRKRMRAFCEVVKLEIEDVKNKIFKYL